VPIVVRRPSSLDVAAQLKVRELAEQIEAADGAPPLSDQALSQLAGPNVTHLLAVTDTDTDTDTDTVVGYAQLDRNAAEVLAETPALDPLLDAVEALPPRREIWAHGQRSRLHPALGHRGYDRTRVLWQLQWPVGAVGDFVLPDGVRLRTFEPGRDEAAWLAVNAAAFAHHPEQGGWTRADIDAREAESWFDARDFLLAEHDTELVGFHWMKMHSPTLGEVYVLGVAPASQGLHLGSALLVAGLDHMQRRGATSVILYVDESNTTAMALYEHYGFQRSDHDTQYQLPALAQPS
jgi:mycothiol synthase